MPDRSLSLGRLPPEQFLRVDELCDRFERAWRAGDRPKIEDYLVAHDEPEYRVLLEELIRLDVEFRRQAGENPCSADYARFSGVDSSWIDANLPQAPTSVIAPGAFVATDSKVESDVRTPTRFKILRKHKEGGLGEVSVALDEELRREVALKQIKEGPAARNRASEKLSGPVPTL